ncbi:MAG TPA: LLM class flavin-dependent oxidoreductase [Thermomicrobiales bacterium]|nr:LLM class flavin-dependent oxidoreductase [Thermomicrobiales bacterium]
MGRGFGIAAAVSHDVTREVAREAERLGYSSFWVNDTPGADGLAALAAAAEVTSAIELGVGVIPLDRRPGEAIAADVEQLGLPRDRLLLGVGSGGDPKGLDRVRAGVDVLQRRVAAPVIVAALGPRMCALAGETAGGVLFNWLTPEFARRSARWVLDAAELAGRPRPRLMAYVRSGLLPEAEARMRVEAERYTGVGKYGEHFKRMGTSAYDTCVSGPDAATLQAGIARHEAELDEAVVRAITPDDSLESILRLLHACAPA